MDLLASVSSVREKTAAWRRNGLRVGLVPTMGYFHEGHLALMREAKRRSDRVVVSLFVNPTQFGPSEDLDRYPRNFERDTDLARGVGVDAIFAPEAVEMYPPGFQTYVTVDQLASGLCGASRPGHFRGVATVVAKLLHIVQPDVAVFGQKDFQQLQVIRRMVADLDIPVEIVGHPIVREADGLAMSSRNVYLSADERESARSLSRALGIASELVAQGETSAERIVEAVRRHILSRPGTRIDYVFLGDPDSLEAKNEVKCDALLALAVWVGRTRLLDNAVLKAPTETPRLEPSSRG